MSTNRLDRAYSIADLRKQARRRLPRAIFEFIDGGAGGETTLAENCSDFGRWRLVPRVGVDVGRRDLSAMIVGVPAALPLLLAPTGLAGLYSPQGEAKAARAAAAAGIPFCLSTNSVASLEEVAAQAPGGDKWFQLYMLKDRPLMWALLDRARGAGYRVLCLTLDLAVQGRRERDMRNAFTVPLRPRLRTVLEVAARPAWLAGFLRAPVRFGNFEQHAGVSGFMNIAQHVASLFDPTADWTAIREVVERWGGPFVVKGVLSPDDALRAVELGARAVIVSNHGGRQLDQSVSAVAALPAVVAAVGSRAQIILDGGVRRGVDLIKARALGADACMIGRPFLWGLSAGGEDGVARALAIFRDELDNGLALVGAPIYAELDETNLACR
ncbi:MAG: alpha-hydroxy-acid oxidizing protein [Xanthobacteraceae bacterium]|jgi:isopentenyl diphosphate isomerase/L-lactate dehydrogenase-like FMN-dependent dehydrogenase|nr:alpha-hydroxy-acid oxidizing protein [Xanthobacteraceae bacterium]